MTRVHLGLACVVCGCHLDSVDPEPEGYWRRCGGDRVRVTQVVLAAVRFVAIQPPKVGQGPRNKRAEQLLSPPLGYQAV